MSKKYHTALNVRGVLRNWDDEIMAGVFTHDDGLPMSTREAKEFLIDELAKGHNVIPCGPACDGFMYSGEGCPGHEETP